MEPGAQVPALSPFPETSPPVRRPVTHSTPAGPALGCSPPAPGGVSCLTASLEATLSSQELVSHPAGLIPATTASRRQLSTIRASGQSSSLSVPGEEPHTSAPEPQQQQGVPQARSGLGTTGLPGIPDAAPRKRRDPQARAAAMERVRQWEIRLLLDIEEAVQHELAVQEETRLLAWMEPGAHLGDIAAVTAWVSFPEDRRNPCTRTASCPAPGVL